VKQNIDKNLGLVERIPIEKNWVISPERLFLQG